MEDSVIFYLLDVEDDWNTWSEQVREKVAVQTLQEWICSENFKEKATYDEISCETTLGRHYLNYQREDQYWKDSGYIRARDLNESIYEYWIEQKWVYEETTRNGRPRSAEYPNSVISKAMRYLNPPFRIEDAHEDSLYKSVAWSRSILGQTSTQVWIRLVVIKDNIFRQIYSKTGVEFFTGRTREEIAEILHLPKPFVNELCRWLQRSGNWEVAYRKVKGVRRREMRYTIS